MRRSVRVSLVLCRRSKGMRWSGRKYVEVVYVLSHYGVEMGRQRDREEAMEVALTEVSA